MSEYGSLVRHFDQIWSSSKLVARLHMKFAVCDLWQDVGHFSRKLISRPEQGEKATVMHLINF
jgi:hypothetical protein